MQAVPVQNHQSGPPPEAGAARGASLFAGRKSGRKLPGGAFAALFARLESAGASEGAANAARAGKGARSERAAAGKAGLRADAPPTEIQGEAAKSLVPRPEVQAARTAEAGGRAAAEDAKSADRELKAARLKPKERQPDAGTEIPAAPIQAAAAPKPAAGSGAQLAKEAGDEGGSGKLEETSRRRGKTRRDEGSGPELRVVDLRLKLDAPSAQDAQAGPRDGGGELSALQGRAEGAGEGGGKADAPAGMEAARGKSFTEVLAARLGSEGAVDIVKAAQIVLKDGDSGLIRLRLEPESLGGVKIELRLAEKSIEGRILVESEEAKAAFEKALDGLKDAFAREGFESSSLEVSVGSEGREGNPGAGPGEDSGPFWSERLSSFDRAVPTERAIEARRAEGRVDILA